MSNGSMFNLYNTADQTTNYERLRADWRETLRVFTPLVGGTGTVQELLLSAQFCSWEFSSKYSSRQT